MYKQQQNLALDAIFILSFITFTVLLSIVKQVLSHHLNSGMTLHYSTIPLALVFTILLDYIIANKTFRAKNYLLLLLIFSVLLLLTKNIELFYPWDGVAYHEPAMYVQYAQQNLLYAPAEIMNFWSYKYPKLSWLFSGELSIFLGKFGALTLYSLLFSTSVLLFSLYFCTIFKIQRYLKYLFTFLITITPIAISQSFTTYVDSSLAALVSLIFLAAIAISRKNDSNGKLVLVLASALIINLKFSGFLYVGVAFLYIGLMRIKNVSKWPEIIGLFFVFVVLGIGALGLNPYVKNLQGGNHIFHPLFGEDKVDIMGANTPSAIKDKNAIYKLLYANFSRTSAELHEENSLKSPLNVSVLELRIAATGVDTRLGGFGPLFPLMLILTVLILALTLRKNAKDIRYDWLFLIFLATFLNPEAWWARYNIPLYLLILTPFITPTNSNKSTTINRINYALFSLLVAAALIQTLLLSLFKVVHLKEITHHSSAHFFKINSTKHHIPENKRSFIANVYDYRHEPFYAKYAYKASRFDSDNYVCMQPQIIRYAMLKVGYCDDAAKLMPYDQAHRANSILVYLSAEEDASFYFYNNQWHALTNKSSAGNYVVQLGDQPALELDLSTMGTEKAPNLYLIETP